MQSVVGVKALPEEVVPFCLGHVIEDNEGAALRATSSSLGHTRNLTE